MDPPNKYICPISQQIFNQPVIAEDGNCYEQTEITKWFNVNQISPITRQSMSNKVYKNILLKNEVEDYLTQNPQFRSDQYIVLEEYKEYRREILSSIYSGQFDELLKYKNFQLLVDVKLIYRSSSKPVIQKKKKRSKLSTLELESDPDSLEITKFIICLLKKCTDEKVIVHVFENSIDLLTRQNSNDYPSAIFYICRYGSSSLINYCLNPTTKIGGSLGWDWNNSLKSFPIQMCFKTEFDRSLLDGKLIVSKYADELFYKDNLKNTIMHGLFECCDEDTIKILIKKYKNNINVWINATNNGGDTPLFALFRNSNLTKSIISMLLKLDIDLTTKNDEGYTPLHMALMFQNKDIVTYILKHKNLSAKLEPIELMYKVTKYDYGYYSHKATPQTLVMMNSRIHDKDKNKIIDII